MPEEDCDPDQKDSKSPDCVALVNLACRAVISAVAKVLYPVKYVTVIYHPIHIVSDVHALFIKVIIKVNVLDSQWFLAAIARVFHRSSEAHTSFLQPHHTTFQTLCCSSLLSVDQTDSAYHRLHPKMCVLGCPLQGIK